MKSRMFTWITAMTLFSALAMPVRLAAQEKPAAQEPRTGVRYRVVDLGPEGPPNYPYSPFLIAGNGLVAGSAPNPDGTVHAVLWYKGSMADLGTPGLGGPNSAGFSVNERGRAVGQAETSVANDEDFCGFNFFGFPSFTACVPFVWQYGVGMTALPTLGGANGFAFSINSRGEVAGLAETGNPDPAPGCTVSEFKPVIWKHGVPHKLPPYPGDTGGVAAFINDKGQVSGASGTCGGAEFVTGLGSSYNPNTGLYLLENHAVLWDSDGTAHDLGNLGGTGGLAGNHACALNNRGEVVGHSVLTNEFFGPFHAFLWTKETLMQDLGTLPGDFGSLALGINDGGDIVGASISPTFSETPVLWEKGASPPVNLNSLVTDNPSGLTLLVAVSINSSGEIVGLAFDSSGNPHGYLATPVAGANPERQDVR